LGNGSRDLPADSVPGPGGLRLGAHQDQDPRPGRRTGWAGFPEVGKAYRRYDSRRRVSDCSESGSRSSSGGPGGLQSGGGEVFEMSLDFRSSEFDDAIQAACRQAFLEALAAGLLVFVQPDVSAGLGRRSRKQPVLEKEMWLAGVPA